MWKKKFWIILNKYLLHFLFSAKNGVQKYVLPEEISGFEVDRVVQKNFLNKMIKEILENAWKVKTYDCAKVLH